MLFSFAQIRWAAEEVKRQDADPSMIVDMLKGLQYAVTQSKIEGEYNSPSLNDILTLGKYVEPGRNTFYTIEGSDDPVNYRRVVIFFDAHHPGMTSCAPQLIPSAMQRLTQMCDVVGEEGAISLDEFMTHFLWIHPWIDGNGRTAAILYNWFNNTLAEPVPLPDYEWDKAGDIPEE